jgi:hypothetical protein
MQRPPSVPSERFWLFLALACWTITSAQVIDAMAYPDFVKRHYLILGVIAIFGLMACFAWARAWRVGRHAVLATAVVYLLLYVLRTYACLVDPLLQQNSFFDTTKIVVRIVWSLATHYISGGRVVAGLSELFYEWLMPLLQLTLVVALLWPLTAGSRGDAPRAARPEIADSVSDRNTEQGARSDHFPVSLRSASVC